MNTQSVSPSFTCRAVCLLTFLLPLACAGPSPTPWSDRAPQDLVGNVALALSLPDSRQITSVHFSLRRADGSEVRQGDINTAAPGATLSAVVGSVPVAAGYDIAVTAPIAFGPPCTGTSARFAVVANAATSVTVVLACRSVSEAGAAVIQGTVDRCPVLTSYSVSPLVTSAGGIIDVAAVAVDIDGDALTYAWTATAGPFESPSQPATRYLCPPYEGQQRLTVTVTDGLLQGTVPPQTRCRTSATVDVRCGLGGNGVIDLDAGEDCEPPGLGRCDSACQNYPLRCGDGVISPPGEQCDPPNATTCDGSCRTIPRICGNAVVQPPEEQCDPPNGSSCDSSCRTVIPHCGDGIIQPGEQCEYPNGFCDAQCRWVDDVRWHSPL